MAPLSMVGCDSEDGDAETVEKQADSPLLGTGELPLSLRHGDAVPAGAVEVELTPAAVRAAGMDAPFTLTSGWAPEATAAIKQAVSGQSAALLRVHANTPYRSLSGALSAIQAAGVAQVAFAVRTGADEGALVPAAFKMVPPTPDEGVDPAAMATASGHQWDDFVAAWETVEGACREGKTGSCAYKPEQVATGGALKILLSAVGQGHTVGFMRLGEPVEPPKPEKKKRKKAKATDPAAEFEQEAPAELAQFQWRAHEATTSPSPISGSIKPICGAGGCQVVVRAEAATIAARVLALLGAAFPDGTPAPKLLLEESK